MEHAAFELPLSDDQLKELGRLVVNCGFVEFLLNLHVGMMFNATDMGRMSLVAPLATRRKIELLDARLAEIRKQETRALVHDACKLVSPTITQRNYLLHGIWGVDSPTDPARAVVVSPKEGRRHFRAEDITVVADKLAIASRQLADASTVDGGGTVEGVPERLVIELAPAQPAKSS